MPVAKVCSLESEGRPSPCHALRASLVTPGLWRPGMVAQGRIWSRHGIQRTRCRSISRRAGCICGHRRSALLLAGVDSIAQGSGWVGCAVRSRGAWRGGVTLNHGGFTHSCPYHSAPLRIRQRTLSYHSTRRVPTWTLCWASGASKGNPLRAMLTQKTCRNDGAGGFSDVQRRILASKWV